MTTALESVAWQTSQCPFRIEFSPGVLEEIRAAVVDAFYSVPRGGVEIGGILFGRTERGCVRIEEWRQIHCEYASGPSFTLSEKDRAGLTALLAGEERKPAGWFHSHTRSEIHLSPADVELYDRFFPGNRQVALVLRPAHLESTRAGFFFREPGGRIASEASYREFPVDAASMAEMAVKPVEMAPVPIRRRRSWLWPMALACGSFAGAGAFATRSYWCIDDVPRIEKLERQLLDQQIRNERLERSLKTLRQRLASERAARHNRT